MDVWTDAVGVAESGAVGSEDSDCVRVIDDQPSVGFVRKRSQVREGCKITVHAEKGFGNQKPPAECPWLLECGTSRGNVFMGEHAHLGAGESATVDEAGMVGSVRHDKIVRAGESGDRGQVGLISTRKRKRGFGTEQMRDGLLEAAVGGQVAADEAARRGTGAMALDRVRGRGE